MKEFIIGSPFLKLEKLTDKDTWLIVACDGVFFFLYFVTNIIKLWDVVEDQQSVDFVLENASLPAPQIAKKLLIKALQVHFIYLFY